MERIYKLKVKRQKGKNTCNSDQQNRINNKNLHKIMNQQQVNKTNNISNNQNRQISKKGTHEKHCIYVIDSIERSMKDHQLQEIKKKYGKVIDQEIRKDSKGQRGTQYCNHNIFNKRSNRKSHNQNKQN